jgi:hypothetical protein
MESARETMASSVPPPPAPRQLPSLRLQSDIRAGLVEVRCSDGWRTGRNAEVKLM